MSDWTEVALVDELAPGARRIVDVEGVQVVVFNLSGEYYAIEDVCTHDYAPLDDAKLEGDEVICPRHGARFCIRTGEATLPPAYEAVTTFPTRVDNGVVQVRDPRWD